MHGEGGCAACARAVIDTALETPPGSYWLFKLRRGRIFANGIRGTKRSQLISSHRLCVTISCTTVNDIVKVSANKTKSFFYYKSYLVNLEEKK